MTRRTGKASPLEVQRPVYLDPTDPDRLVADLHQRWVTEAPDFDDAPFIERFGALPEATRQRHADLLAMSEHPDVKRQTAADAKAALLLTPEAADLLVLALVHCKYHDVACSAVRRFRHAPARPALFALCLRESAGNLPCFVATLAALDAIDDELIDRAIEAIDRAPLAVQYMLADLLSRRHDVDRAFEALLARFPWPGCAHAAASAIERRGQKLPEQIPRLHALLSTTVQGGVAQAAAKALAAMGDAEGVRWLEREARANARI